MANGTASQPTTMPLGHDDAGEHDQRDDAADRRGARARRRDGLPGGERRVGDEQPGGDVEQQAGAAGDDDEQADAEAHEQRVDAQVLGEAAADAAQDAVGARPREASGLGRGRRWWGCSDRLGGVLVAVVWGAAFP